jgi:hypothetical protein
MDCKIGELMIMFPLWGKSVYIVGYEVVCVMKWDVYIVCYEVNGLLCLRC